MNGNSITFGILKYTITLRCAGRVCITSSSVQPAIVHTYTAAELERLIPMAYGPIKEIYQKALKVAKVTS